MDDGSITPLKKGLGEEFPHVRWYRQDRQKGVSASRNLGIRKARNPWIAFLDSDDQWMPEKLEAQCLFHQANPEIFASHTNETWIRNGNQVMPPAYLDKSPEGLFERSLERCLICPSSVLVHRSILDQIGLFDEELPVCEDYDLWLRLMLVHEIGLVPQALVRKFGGHADQLSRENWGMDRFRVLSLQKLISQNLNPSDRRSILDALTKKCDLLAKGFAKHDKDKISQRYFALGRRFRTLFSEASHEACLR